MSGSQGKIEGESSLGSASQNQQATKGSKGGATAMKGIAVTGEGQLTTENKNVVSMSSAGANSKQASKSKLATPRQTMEVSEAYVMHFLDKS